jgi:ribosomal protein L21
MENIGISQSGDKSYKVLNGTFYNIETPDRTVKALEKIRLSGERIILDYGDINTGKSFGDIYDITGTISRSTGPNKIPILVFSSRSSGGGGILSHCILKIVSSKGKNLLYKF